MSSEFRRRLYVSGERSSFIALSLKMETYFSLNIDNQLKTKRGQTEVKTTENMFYYVVLS